MPLGGGYTSQLIAKGRKGVVCGQPGCDVSLPGVSTLSVEKYFVLDLHFRLNTCPHLNSRQPKSVKRLFLVPMVVLSAVSALDKGHISLLSF